MLVSIEADRAVPREVAEFAPLDGESPTVLFLADPTDEQLRGIIALLVAGEVVGIALLEELPPPQWRWLAYEYRSCVVTSVGLHPELLVAGGWRADERGGYLVWRSPADASETSDQFGQHVLSATPHMTEVSVELDLADQRVFGPLAADQLGGSSALMALSGAHPAGRTVVLRNLAALELDLLTEPDSIPTLTAGGAIQVSVVGASAQTAGAALDLQSFTDAKAALRVWADADRTGDFFLVIQAFALVDPPVAIPPGHIFEQRSVNGTQTLAAAAGASFVVAPGSPATVVVPAWCLNQSLSSPSGQLLRPTPLRVRYSAGTSQSAVWQDRRRVLSN